MPWTILVTFAYGVITILLGVAGFVNKGSIASLISAGICGVLILVGGALARHHPRIGFGIALVISIALLGRFGVNLVKKHDIYPDGIIVLTSLVGLAAAIAGISGHSK